MSDDKPNAKLAGESYDEKFDRMKNRAIKHTPTPWYYDGEDMDSEAAASWDGNGYEIFSKDEDGNVTNGIAGGIPEEADAAHIVHCVNMHEELVELAEMGEKLKCLPGCEGYTSDEDFCVRCRAEAILAKVKSHE